ncbi:MAG: hypothetical protein KC561_05160 [Myxococcales bacterium]|nr:hypothetical protein [Myxococcales bacterium]
MMRTSLSMAMALALALLVIARVAEATIVLPEPIKESVQHSGMIARIYIDRVTLIGNDPDYGWPLTEVTAVTTGDFGWGTPLEKFSLILNGGIDKDDTVTGWIGAPEFLPGREYVVFLASYEWVMTPVTNWGYTVFEVADLDGKLVWLYQDGRCVGGFDDEWGFHPGPQIEIDTHHRYLVEVYGQDVAQMSTTGEPEYAGACIDAETLGEALSGFLRSQDPPASGPQLSPSFEIFVEVNDVPKP